jgi:hypothetical protein
MSGKKPKVRPKEGPDVFKDKIIGKPIDFIPTTRLPTKRLVLQRARALRAESTENKERFSSPDKSDKDIAQTVAVEIQSLWQRAAIPCRRVDKVKELVLKAMCELSLLMKSWSHYTEDQDLPQTFILSLDKLFDVSHADLHHMLFTSSNPAWQEDWQCYQQQSQVPQVGSMGGRDKLLEERLLRRQRRDAQLEARREKEVKACTMTSSTSPPCTILPKQKTDIVKESAASKETSGYALRDQHQSSFEARF